MLEQPTKADLEKAHLILSEFGLLIGPAGAMSDVIARAVAAGNRAWAQGSSNQGARREQNQVAMSRALALA